MTRIGAFSPDDAELVIRVVRKLQSLGLVAGEGDRGVGLFPPSTSVYFRNDSGSIAPAYACLQVTGTVEIGGQNYLTVDQPADAFGIAGGYVFNGPEDIEIDGLGTAQSGSVVRALTDGTAVTAGDSWMPEASAWAVQKADCDTMHAIGADDIDTNIGRFFLPSPRPSGLFRFTLNAGWTSNVADADILLLDATDTGEDHDVEDPLAMFTDLATDDAGYCKLQNGKFIAIQAPCGTA